MSLDTDTLIDRRRLKRRLFFWRFAAIVAAVALVAMSIGLWRDGIEPGEFVALLEVDGVIVEDNDRIDAIRDLAGDDRVTSVLVAINSPGGTTYGSETLFLALREVAAKKPVVAVIGTVGASGGYMTALAADRIFAQSSSITGSIGVIWQTTEFSRLLDKVGVATEAVKSGPLKGEPSPFAPMSDDARRAIRAMVEESHAWFVGLVADRRGMDTARAGALADGRIYTGTTAVENGLIDELGGEQAARNWLYKTHGIDRDVPLVAVEYGEDDTIWRRALSGAARLLTGKSILPEGVTLDGLISVWHPGHDFLPLRTDSIN
jgi:protease-4